MTANDIRQVLDAILPANCAGAGSDESVPSDILSIVRPKCGRQNKADGGYTMETTEIALLLLVGGFVIAVIWGTAMTFLAISGNRRVDQIERQFLLLKQSIEQRIKAIEQGATSGSAPPETPSPEALPNRVPVTATVPQTGPSAIAGPLASTSAPPAHRNWSPESMRDLERRAGQRWMTWLGAMALAVGMIFLIKYSFERGWIGPTVRLVGGLGLGLFLLTVGEWWAQRRQYAALAQGFMATGLAISQGSLFAAYHFHDLLSQPIAFAGMVVVSILGMVLAVFHDFLAFAILALISGFLTPLLLSTGQDGRDPLFAYVLLLDLSVLGILLWRRWRWLDLVAFAGSVFLFTSWFDAYYSPAGMGPALTWLFVLYAVFVVIPVTTHWRHQQPLPGDRLLLACFNAGFALVMSAQILWRDDYERIAWIAVLMAVVYLVSAWIATAHGRRDSRLVLTHIALAVSLITIAIPIYFDLDTFTLVWSMEAVVLVYLGQLYRYAALRRMAALVLGLSLLRGLITILDLTGTTPLPILHREFALALIAPMGAGIFAMLLDRRGQVLDNWDQLARATAGISAGLGVLTAFSVEMLTWFAWRSRETGLESLYWYYSLGFAVSLWSLGALAFVIVGVYRDSVAARGIGVVISCAIVATAVLFLLDPWAHEYIAWIRPLSVALCVVALYTMAWWIRPIALRGVDERPIPAVLTALATGLLWLLLTMETYAYCSDRWGGQGSGHRMALSAVTLVWALYAAALIVFGFVRPVWWARVTGLALFGLTACKVVVIDLSQLEDLPRIAAFLGIGVLMIGASYLYHRLERRLQPRTT